MGKTRGLIRFDKPLGWGWGIRGWQCWTAMFIGNQARHGQFKYLVASNNSPIPVGIWLCWGPFETLGQKANHLPGYFQGCKTTYSKHFLYNLYFYTTISWNSTGITYLDAWRKLGSLGCCTSLYNVQPGKKTWAHSLPTKIFRGSNNLSLVEFFLSGFLLQKGKPLEGGCFCPRIPLLNSYFHPRVPQAVWLSIPKLWSVFLYWKPKARCFQRISANLRLR